MRQQAIAQRGKSAALPRPLAVLVERTPQMPLCPGIEQHVARPAIEPGSRVTRRQIGEIGDAADVENDAMRCRRAEHRVVEGRYQWRTLPTSRDVAAAEVGNDVDTGQFGQQRRIVQL